MSETEQTARFIGALVAATVAGLVAADARRRGLPLKSVLGWGAGVFCLLIVFLPLYLWSRRNASSVSKTPRTAAAPIAGVPCRYCGYENADNPDFCGKCGRQQRSSIEIHR